MTEAIVYCNFKLFGHIFQGRLFTYGFEPGDYYYLNQNGTLFLLNNLIEDPIPANIDRHEIKQRFSMLSKGEFGQLIPSDIKVIVDLYPHNDDLHTEGSACANAIFKKGNLIGFSLN